MVDGQAGGRVPEETAGPAPGVSRRGVLKGAGVLGVGVLAGQALLLRSVARQSAPIQHVIDVAITAESLAVTFLGVARKMNDDGKLDIKDLIPFVESAQCEEQAHYNFLDSAGAKPLATSFTIPDAAVKDKASFVNAVIALEATFVAAYMAAARRFANTGDLRLVEIAYQIGAVEAQHLVLANAAAGMTPANNRAFAEWMFADVDEAVAALKAAGYLGGAGTKIDAPGPLDPVCQGVFGLVPETTPATAATPGAGTPSAGASPAASPAGTPAS